MRRAIGGRTGRRSRARRVRRIGGRDQHLSAGALVSQTLDGAEFDGTADALVWAGPNNDNASETNSLVDNGGFEVAILSGEWVTGNSPVKIRLFYRTLRKASMEAIA